MRLFGFPRRLPTLPALAAATILAAAVPAQADSLAVQVAPELALPDAQVRAVIAAELGTEIVERAADLGTIELRLDLARQLVVTYRRADGTTLERVVALPALAADQLALIAFVAGNLVRDQLADLVDAGAAAPTPPAVSVESGLPASVPVGSGLPASVQVGSAAPIAPAPMLVTAAPGLPPSPEAAETVVPVSLGLVPPLSTDRLFASRARVYGALNIIAGSSAAIYGVSLAGAADITGRLYGLQLAGAVTVAGNGRGLQIAGAGALARDLVGAQLAGAASVGRDVQGLQIAGAGAVARDFVGIQMAGAGSVAHNLRGLQIAGGTSVARDVYGLQMAGGAAVGGEVAGAQLASINVAGSLHGLQLGAINIAGRASGLQLGAINISDSSDGAQIGALNFVRNGRTDIDAWAETTGLAAVALRHGGRHVHNVYAIGWTPDGGETPLLGLGLGFHRSYGGTTLDLDAMAWQTHLFADGVGLLSQARATVAVDLGPVAAFVAAAYNVSIEDEGETRPVRTMFARTVDTSMSGVEVALWPSLSAGVRGHLSAAR